MNILLTTLNAKYIHKNLALRWIYQACPQKDNVRLIEYTIKDDMERIIKQIQEGEYDLVCFSVYIWNIDYIKPLILRLKQDNENLKILVGGPEVSYESYDLIDQGVDAISIGEGEESLWEYVEMLDTQSSYEIPGIYTKEFPNTTYRKVSIAFLETLDDPYFMDIDQDDMDKRYLYLETSRGCPYGCEYCLSSCDRDVRMFSLEYVMKILEKIKKSSVRQVKLLDRTFNANPKRALEIAKYMNDECTTQIFQFEIVAETLSEELLLYFEQKADKERFRFEIGVQSFHAPTLQAVGRIQNNQRLKEVITRLKDAQVMMHVDLIAGLPYEDLATFQASFDELFALETKEIQLGILKLLKGTKLKQKHAQYEFVQEEQSPYAIKSTHWLSEEELILIDQAAHAVEKLWNDGKCRFTIKCILANGWYKSAFALFLALGEGLAQLPHPYAPQNLFTLFYDVVKNVDKTTLTAVLFTDYYALFKQRPPHFGDLRMSDENRKKIVAYLLTKGFTKEELYHYTFLTYAYDDVITYQAVVYNASQTLPKRYIIDTELQRVKELT